MGNRAVTIVTDERGWWSPCIYLHWNGGDVPEFIKAALPRMRKGDASYSAARLIGVIHENMDGNLSLGVYENGWERKAYEAKNEGRVWSFSNGDLEQVDQGDNGIYIYNCSNGKLTQYLRVWDPDNPDDDEPGYDSKIWEIPGEING